MAYIFGDRDVSSVGFVGFGKSTRGVYSYLSERYRDLSFTVRDRRELPLPCGVRGFFGENELSNIDEDVLFLSPTVRRERLELTLASERGVRLTSDAEFFFDNFSGEALAVTGSNGKSTTATLASLITGFSAIGNIGEPMTPHASSAEAFVLELSSFQLNYFTPKTRRALITNIVPNHLDWHTSFEEYREAKLRLAYLADEFIICADSEELLLARFERVPFALYSIHKTPRELFQLRAEHYLYLDGGYLMLDGERIASAAQLLRREYHNVQNALGAMALSIGYADRDRMAEAILGFRGLPHRCEYVGAIGGVEFYDSSIDSTPERTAQTLSALPGKSTVILGGRSKGLDPEPLIAALQRSASAIILTGENKEELRAALRAGGTDDTIRTLEASDFEEAVRLGYECTLPYGRLILSPASTSYDRFSNFEERGNCFKEVFLSLKGR